MFVIVDDKGKVIATHVDQEVFTRSVEAPDDIVFGDIFNNGEWIRCGERPSPPLPEAPSLEERLMAVEEAILMIL